MEILLLIVIGMGAYVLFQRSRGREVGAGSLARGCLGLGCLGTLILLIVGIVLLWLLLQAVADIDLSVLDHLLDEDGGGGRDGGGGGGGGAGSRND